MNALLLQKFVDYQFLFFGHFVTFTLTGYAIVIILVNIIVYGLYIKRLLKRDKPPPLSVWGLFLLLNAIFTTAEFARGTFNLQMVAYTVGTLIVFLFLLRLPNREWSIWDTITTVFVVLAVVTFCLVSSKIGSYVALFGITVANLPLFWEIKKGCDEPLDAWSLALFGSFLCYLSEGSLSSKWNGSLQAIVILLIIVFWKKRKLIR